jgi:NAD-dependent dihydropyrimidine dehydrogenase PreA subunit/predicted transcriptional regulator
MSKTALYEQLAEGVGAGGSATIVKIFKTLADESEAKILLAASPPANVEEISQKTGLTNDDIQKMTDSLFQKGLMFKSKKEGPTRYYRVRNIVQFHDSTAVSKDLSPEVSSLWREYMATEWEGYREKMVGTLPQARLRVIPVNISIDAQTKILAFDDIKNLIAGAKNIAVTNCACRAVEGACNKPLEVCFQINRSADYAIERGTGRKLSKEEAIEMLKVCEEEGLVHCASNQRSPDHVICNCCDCCCIFWNQMKYVVPSRFEAVVDPELCTACETCLERCHFDAITMEGDEDTALVDHDDCMGCGLCLVTCPAEAISLKQVRPENFVPE